MDFFTLFLLLALMIAHAILMGIATRHVAICRGYERGFWWGALLGVVGLAVVGLCPVVRRENGADAQ